MAGGNSNLLYARRRIWLWYP